MHRESVKSLRSLCDAYVSFWCALKAFKQCKQANPTMALLIVASLTCHVLINEDNFCT